MSDKNRIVDKKQKITVSIISILLVLVLVIVAALAWFATEDSETKAIQFGIGKVAYTLPQVDNLFYSSYEFEDDYYEEEPDIEDGNYIPATDVSNVYIGGEAVEKDISDIYVCNLEKGLKSRLTVSLAPVGSTDKVTFSSSDPTVVSVSTYGTIRALGRVGASAVITITVTDRDTSSSARPNQIIVQVRVNVTQSQSTEDHLYGFLPGNVNLLKTPLVVKNMSTVSSKCRVKIGWEYTDYTSDDTRLNERKTISVDDLQKLGTHFENVTYTSSVKAPLHLDIEPGFQYVPALAGTLSFGDINGKDWTIEVLSLTDEEKQSITAALNDASGNTKFSLTEKMVDKAYIYVCYSDSAITDGSTDYGSQVAKNTATGGTDYSVLSGITTNSDYAAFSSRKVFTVSMTVQARQAKAYSETDWYDVYCAKVEHSH